MSAQKSSKTATKPDVVAKKMKRKHSKKSRKSVPSKQSVHIDNNSDSDQSSSSESSAEESPDVLEDDSDEDDSRAVKSLLSSGISIPLCYSFLSSKVNIGECIPATLQTKCLKLRDQTDANVLMSYFKF